jgi:hypothetical protein
MIQTESDFLSGHSEIGYWSLFGVWDLIIGIFV